MMESQDCLDPVLVFVFYIFLLIAVSIYLIKKKRTFILILIICGINIFLLFQIDNFCLSIEKTLVHIYQALCMFFGALDYSNTIEAAKGHVYYNYLRLIVPLQFCVSILYSITFTINYFSFLLDKWIYFFLRKNIYIFSHLNPQSITLAKDIYKHNSVSNIVFCHINEHSEYFKTYLKDLKKINALLLDKSIKDIYLKKNASIFLISDDDITNIHLLDQISHQCKNNKSITTTNASAQKQMIIYPFIKQRNHEIYTDNSVELKTPVKVINEVDLIIYDILLNQAPLPADHELKIIIIGAGKIGTRFLKAIYWYCTFPNVTISMTVITPHCDQTIHELKCDCPEIFNDKNRTDNTFTIRNSKIITFKEFDVRNSDFIDYMNSNRFDYYFVALGDDNLNAQISIRIRQSLAQHYLSTAACFSKPIITIIMDPNFNNIVSKMKTYVEPEKQEIDFYYYKIDCYGRYNDIYSWSKMIDNPLLNAATRVFVNREANDNSSDVRQLVQKNDFQCNHRSNIAFILHIQCKLHILAKNQYKLMMADNKHPSVSFLDLLKDSELNKLANIEHERWRCFYETEGFQYVDDETIDHYKSDFGLKNYLAKLHPALCNQHQLQQRKERFKTKYIENDINLILNTDKIIEDELIITTRDKNNE